jgi:hypothetical protein
MHSGWGPSELNSDPEPRALWGMSFLLESTFHGAAPFMLGLHENSTQIK